MRMFAKTREVLADNLNIGIEIEDIKKKLNNQDKNNEQIFFYLDQLIEEQENPEPVRRVGYRRASETD